jgi:hypothetical protein
MATDAETPRKPKKAWVLILLLSTLIAAPVLAAQYWSNPSLRLWLLGFYLLVGLALKSPVILCTLLGVLISPYLGMADYASENDVWNELIFSGGLGFLAGLIVELVWADYSRNDGLW